MRPFPVLISWIELCSTCTQCINWHFFDIRGVPQTLTYSDSLLYTTGVSSLSVYPNLQAQVMIVCVKKEICSVLGKSQWKPISESSHFALHPCSHRISFKQIIFHHWGKDIPRYNNMLQSSRHIVQVIAPDGPYPWTRGTDMTTKWESICTMKWKAYVRILNGSMYGEAEWRS